MLKQRFQRGDTIIEVLFAITVFSLAAVGGLSLVNQGLATAQRSLEVTAVRQQIDAQAQTLRFLHNSYVAAYQVRQTFNLTDSATSPAEEYYKIIQASPRSAASSFALVGTSCPAVSSRGFILNPRKARFTNNNALFTGARTYAQLEYTSSNTLAASRGLWIEGVRSSTVTSGGTTAPGYIDFHIRACWSAPGSKVPMTIGTIVRLYEPRN